MASAEIIPGHHEVKKKKNQDKKSGSESREFSSPKKVIRPRELPLEGKPDNFTGAVGDFVFNLSTTKNSLNATESLQAKIEVSGKI